MADTADALMHLMMQRISEWSYERASSDPESPTRGETLEAAPFCSFFLSDVSGNVPKSVSLDLRWAVANVLHFFAATEEAGILRRYNAHADRFLAGDKWVGAYGEIAMPQILTVCEDLRDSPRSRRAIVSMGEAHPQDANRPACWNVLHFLQQDGRLHMCCYQRSLNLTGVAAYDLIVLTNVAMYAAKKAGLLPGGFTWVVGSLHKPKSAKFKLTSSVAPESLILPFSVLDDSFACYDALRHPESSLSGFWRETLSSQTEVRT